VFRHRSPGDWQRRAVLTPRLLVGSIAAIALLAAGCGSNAHPAASAQTATAGTGTSTAPTPGAQLRGADYALALASGWRDTTASRQQAAEVDRVIAQRNPRAVTVIALLRAPTGVSASKLLRDRAKRELAGVHATAHTAIRPLTLDGAKAITYQYRGTSKAGARIQARQVLAVHGRRLHVITMIASRTRFQPADTALGAMLGSWRWTTA
jgi:hypothetical protein